jgi:hypothetical protein
LRRSFKLPWCFGIFIVFAQAAAEFPLHNPAVAAWQFSAIGCMLVSRDSNLSVNRY